MSHEKEKGGAKNKKTKKNKKIMKLVDHFTHVCGNEI
jgi:hypothetical protein